MASWIDHCASFLALVLLEIVLGIDNLVFISILVDRLPKKQQKLVRQIGLSLAWILRLLLLASTILLTKLKAPILSFESYSFSIRDLILLAGGLFLLFKATDEIHAEVADSSPKTLKAGVYGFYRTILQLICLDLIFSLDSIFTAVGLTDNFIIMAIAITIAILLMLFASEPLGQIVSRFPSVKMLALSYLMLIGMVLVADGFNLHIPRGYLYFAMAFSLVVESLNLLRSKKNNKK